MKKNTVITFHVIPNAKWFEEIVLLLKSMFTIITMDQAYERFSAKSTEKGLCLITFDDGDLTFIENAMPVLTKHKLPATLFLSPKIVMEHSNFWHQEMHGYDKEQFLQVIEQLHGIDPAVLRPFDLHVVMKCFPIDEVWAMIHTYQQRFNEPPKSPQCIDTKMLGQILDSKLVTIGGHTIDHPILRNENAKRSRKEIIDSVQQLRKLTNTDVHYFAYPNGIPDVDFNEREQLYLKECGVRLSFSTDSQYLGFRDANAFSMPRIGISYGDPGFVKRKLTYLPAWNLVRGVKGMKEQQKRRKVETLINQKHHTVTA